MNLQQLIGSKFTVNVDGRASKRDVGVPERIIVESSFRLGDRAKQIDDMVRDLVVPTVFVDADANVWQLTAGGSGVIVFESADGSPLTDEQGEAVKVVEKALEDHFGVTMKHEPKKRAKKQKEPDVLLGVAYEDEPVFTDFASLSDVVLENGDE